jgi:hydroxymethylbilane synthase
MRIGTRGSALAVAQADWVVASLRERGIESELVRLSTAGDRGERLADKSRWVSELERALLERRIDVAVHSAKDVPAELAEGTELAAIPLREDPRDVLCGAASLEALPGGARVGTSSLRRAAQLRALRPDLELVELRGNVDTRLRKLAGEEVDALVLAIAGLRRLGLLAEAGGTLDSLVPAAGQGALALQALTGSAAAAALAALSDPATSACVGAERELTRALGASCNTAVGAFAEPAAGADGEIELRCWVGVPDGSEWLADRLTGQASAVGAQLAERMLAAGALELLRRAEREAT